MVFIPRTKVRENFEFNPRNPKDQKKSLKDMKATLLSKEYEREDWLYYYCSNY
jgi:hypothetical protein